MTNETPRVETENAEISIVDEATAEAAMIVLGSVVEPYGVEPPRGAIDPPPQDIPQEYKLDHDNPFHLQWAYEESDGSIGQTMQYFDVSKTTVRNNLMEAGIHDPDAVDGEPGYRDRDTLKSEFEKHNRDIAATADHFGVSERTISNWVYRFDLNQDPPWRDEEKLREVYEDNGRNVEWTADEFEASPSTIRRWLRKYNMLDEDEPDESDVESEDVEADGAGEYGDIDPSTVGSIDLSEYGPEYTVGNVAAVIDRNDSFYDIGDELSVSRAEAHRLCTTIGVEDAIAGGADVSFEEIKHRLRIATNK